MTRQASLVDAELDALKKRSAFRRTAAALKARLEPRRIATQAVEDGRARAIDLAHDPVGAVRHRPAMAILLAAGVAVWVVRRSRRRMKS